jgi:peptidyl-Asp metalloendopeptidase
MNKLRVVLRIFNQLSIAGILTIAASTALAKAPETDGLFSDETTKSRITLPKHALKGKSRAVKINHRKLRNGRFSVSLPGDVSYEVVRESQNDMGKGRFAWVGHASDDPDNRVVIGISGDAVSATFAYHGKLFKLEPRADGSHVVSEVNNTDPAPEFDPIAIGDPSLISSSSSTTSPSSSMPDTGGAPLNITPAIDVLVAYTPAIAALYGTAGADALIIQAVAEANQAYVNSKMTTRLNLVRSVLTNYTESGDIYTDLNRMYWSGDGYMDELHSLRNEYAADVVSLIANAPQSCGLAFRMTVMSTAFASNAFSVVHHSCATGYYSFAHEIGHNQGAHHDSANASGAIFPYAYGYQDPLKRFRTIMAYDCPGGCPRGGGFSHGDNPLYGIPTGDPNYASNARAIDETAPVVAAFRQAVVAPPAAPTNLHDSESGTSFLRVDWSDTSNNESGFVVERSLDGFNFQQIASVPTDTDSYIDNELQAGKLYYYRVRAWNSTSFSNYSNTAVATTAAEPSHVDQFAVAELSLGGIMTGNFEDTASQDGSSETITEVRNGYFVKINQYGYLEHYWLINVQQGQAVTLYADVNTNAQTQSFTFAYATTLAALSVNKEVWTDMFTVSAQNPGHKQYTLPASLSGAVFVSVRDNERVPGLVTSDALNIDYMMIRTQLEAAPTPVASIALAADGYKVQGKQRVDLQWTGSNAGAMDIYRGNALLGTTSNTGTYRDNINIKGTGSYNYEVCEAGKRICSNTVPVVFQ